MQLNSVVKYSSAFPIKVFDITILLFVLLPYLWSQDVQTAMSQGRMTELAGASGDGRKSSTSEQ
jgi:hypothetical protein